MSSWLNDERELLARTLTAEAGNQGPQGLLAAGSVIMNRAKQGGYGDGIRGVILKPGQFSPLNSLTGYAGGEQGQNMAAIKPTPEAYQVADALISGNYQDPTGGATHFYNPDISSPSWGGGDGWTRIGDHVFGRADAGRGGNMQPNVNQRAPVISTSGAAQQPSPQGQTDEPFYKNPDFWDRLAIGFSGMTLNPNEALISASAQRIDRRAEGRQTEKQRNATAEWLRSQGRDDLADAVSSGAIGGRDALGLMQPEKRRDGVVVGGRIVDPQTGEVIYEDTGAPSYEAKDVSSARKEFTSLPQVKAFGEQTSAYGRIIASVSDPSPAGDLALIFNYMKVLDPGSVVREGEFATAQNAGGVDQRVRSLYNNIISGERLTPEQRADFADRATRLYGEADQQYRSISEQYKGFAAAAGLPVDQVIPDFGYSGQMYQTPLEFRRPPAPTGISADEWAKAWSAMTDEERAEFMAQ